MTKISYADDEGHTVTASKRNTQFGVQWLITGSFIRDCGEWVPDGFYFDKWVKNWEAAGLRRVS